MIIEFKKGLYSKLYYIILALTQIANHWRISTPTSLGKRIANKCENSSAITKLSEAYSKEIY